MGDPSADLFALVTAAILEDNAAVAQVLRGMTVQEVVDTLIVAVGEMAEWIERDPASDVGTFLAEWRTALEAR